MYTAEQLINWVVTRVHSFIFLAIQSQTVNYKYSSWLRCSLLNKNKSQWRKSTQNYRKPSFYEKTVILRVSFALENYWVLCCYIDIPLICMKSRIFSCYTQCPLFAHYTFYNWFSTPTLGTETSYKRTQNAACNTPTYISNAHCSLKRVKRGKNFDAAVMQRYSVFSSKKIEHLDVIMYFILYFS